MQSILFMDDEEMVTTLAQKMLGAMGYDVVTVKDGQEAIETYKRQLHSEVPFDVVILDLTIKDGMGGDQVFRRLMEMDTHVKAIVSSGYFNDPVMADYQIYGFKGVIAKPYQMKDMKAVLEKVLWMEA